MQSPFNFAVHILVVFHTIFLLPHHVRLVLRRAKSRAARARSRYRRALEYLVMIILVGVMVSPAMLYLNASIEIAMA